MAVPDCAKVHALTVSVWRAGLAVLADMLLTTHFMALVMLTIWRLPLILVAIFYCIFAPIEGTYLSSTLEKIPTGACQPYMCALLEWSLAMGLVSFTASFPALHEMDGLL